MSSHVVGRRLLRTVPLVGLVLASVGCPDEAAKITKFASSPSQEFPITRSFVATSGAFAIDRFRLVAFDTTVSNSLGTRVAGNSPFYSTTGTQLGAGWSFRGFDRNGLTDPRLPLIVDNDAVVVPSGTQANRGFVIGGPNRVGTPGQHNPFVDGTITGLNPSATYIVAFFRYGIVVNGQLDASLVARSQPVDAPDALVPVGGTPKGDPAVPIVSFKTVIPAQSDANPFVLGQFTTDASGVGTFDVVIDTRTPEGDSILYLTTSSAPPAASFDLSLVARNDDTMTVFPRYNYLVVLEGPATDAADAADNPQVLRFQMAQDFLASTGAAVNNGYAPFPRPFTGDRLARAPGGAGNPDSVRVTFNALPALDTAGGNPRRYQAWLVDLDGGERRPAPGTYQRLAGSPLAVVETVTGTSSWVGGQTSSHRLILNNPGLGAGPQDSLHRFTHLVLTVDDSPGDATISSSQPFWVWYTNRKDPADPFDNVSTPQGTTPRFGRFDLSDPVASVAFGAQGTGTGSVREGILNVDLQALSRPPVGYTYAGWILGPDTVRLPDLTGPLPQAVSLSDADEQTIPGLVTENGILEANIRFDSGAAALDLSEYGGFRVTIEPKARVAGMGPTRTLTGTLP